MHEFAITESIIRICVEEAEKQKVKKVTEIRIKMGEFSGLVPECLQYYFEIMSKGTIAESARIKVEKIPIQIQCKECGEYSPVREKSYLCLSCGSKNVKIIRENSFFIDSLEVE